MLVGPNMNVYVSLLFEESGFEIGSGIWVFGCDVHMSSGNWLPAE
jgi:hypothetical protein